MIETPFGNIAILIDGEEVSYIYEAVEKDDTCPNIAARFKIIVPYKNSSDVQQIACILRNDEMKGFMENGQDFQSMNFFKDNTKLTIGAKGEFYYFGRLGHDYDGDYLPQGLYYSMFENTHDQDFIFGIAWIFLKNENDYDKVQTWLATDPSSM